MRVCGHFLPRFYPFFNTPNHNVKADVYAMSSWAIDSIEQVQSAGIMGDIGNNRFNPQGTLSREQSIAALTRLFNNAFGDFYVYW